MTLLQTGIITTTVLVFSLVYWKLTAQFELSTSRWLMALPILTFSVGFLLRLSGAQEFIDAGYFLTEISHVIIGIFFATMLYFGQSKYYGVSKAKQSDL